MVFGAGACITGSGSVVVATTGSVPNAATPRRGQAKSSVRPAGEAPDVHKLTENSFLVQNVDMEHPGHKRFNCKTIPERKLTLDDLVGYCIKGYLKMPAHFTEREDLWQVFPTDRKATPIEPQIGYQGPTQQRSQKVQAKTRKKLMLR